MMQNRRRLYLNHKQREIITAQQKDRTAIWGRGVGKSHCMGLTQRIKAQVMPRSKGFISSTTYKQLLTKTWAGIEKSWSMLGMKEGRDYVVGIQPPKHFDSPISKVKNYSNIVSLKNGRIIEFLSMDRPDLARGGSYDDGEIDECLLVKLDHINVVLWPSIRGNLHRFHHTHWHQSMIKFSSMPWKSEGLYLLDFKTMAERYPDEYFYSEATAWDNIHILGEEGIERLRQKLTPIQFAMEVENRLIIRSEEPFYYNYNDDTHLYKPGYNYGQDQSGREVVLGTNDVNTDAPIDTSWDFGGWFSCCAVFQENDNREERMVNAFKAGADESLTNIVTSFCDTYVGHQFKLIRMYGEPHGHDRNANMTDSNYDFLRKEFYKRGWKVQVIAPKGTSRKQKERRVFMGTIMAEDTRGYPHFRMNRDTCEWCDIALKGTKTDPDGSKNKKAEKDKSFPQEHAPHITDAIDYYFDQKWGPRLSHMGRTTIGTAGSVEFL